MQHKMEGSIEPASVQRGSCDMFVPGKQNRCQKGRKTKFMTTGYWK